MMVNCFKNHKIDEPNIDIGTMMILPDWQKGLMTFLDASIL